MRKTILPISLLNEKAKNARVHILDTEPYDSVFGNKKTRKKPNFKVSLRAYVFLFSFLAFSLDFVSHFLIFILLFLLHMTNLII